MDLTPLERSARSVPFSRRQAHAAIAVATPTAAQRILAAELANRGDGHDALSLMVESIALMVQAGKMRDSRWKSS